MIMRGSRWLIRSVLGLLLVPLVFGAAPAGKAAPQPTLEDLVADLQQSPDDQQLREKIITLARDMKPAPAVPEEARRNFVKGNAALQDAQDGSDYDRAIGRYQEALLLAPWWPDPYFNMAQAFELREQYEEAIAALQLYLLAAPQAEDARAAQDMIYALEDKHERAGSAHAEATRQQAEAEEFLRSLDGARFVAPNEHLSPWGNLMYAFDATITVGGNEVIFDNIITGGDPDMMRLNYESIGEPYRPRDVSALRFPLNGRAFTFVSRECECEGGGCRGEISEDGSRISVTNPNAVRYSSEPPGRNWTGMCLRDPIIFSRRN